MSLWITHSLYGSWIPFRLGMFGCRSRISCHCVIPVETMAVPHFFFSFFGMWKFRKNMWTFLIISIEYQKIDDIFESAGLTQNILLTNKLRLTGQFGTLCLKTFILLSSQPRMAYAENLLILCALKLFVWLLFFLSCGIFPLVEYIFHNRNQNACTLHYGVLWPMSGCHSSCFTKYTEQQQYQGMRGWFNDVRQATVVLLFFVVVVLLLSKGLHFLIHRKLLNFVTVAAECQMKPRRFILCVFFFLFFFAQHSKIVEHGGVCDVSADVNKLFQFFNCSLLLLLLA